MKFDDLTQRYANLDNEYRMTLGKIDTLGQ